MKSSPARTPLFWPISILVAFVALLAATSSGYAAPTIPPGPDRYKAIVVNYTTNTWYLATFRANHIVCKIVVEYEGIPNLEDVYASCGEDLTNEWINQPICNNVDRPNHCKGYYIFLAESVPGQRDVAVELPPPSVWVDVTDCLAVSSLATSVCEYVPKLQLTGEEPLPEYNISRIEGNIN